jgi:hypothetical protein
VDDLIALALREAGHALVALALVVDLVSGSIAGAEDDVLEKEDSLAVS